MTVFRYDRSFEGLLTAVFDAYFRRVWPERLLQPEEVAPLFAEEDHRVAADPQKSARVWAGLQKKAPHEACNMISLAWLSEAPGVDMMLMRYMRRVFDSGAYADFTDPDTLKIKQLAAKVSNDRTRLLQFTRFQKGGDGTFFAPVSPRYNVLPLVVEWFRDRFRDQQWIIYDIDRKYGYLYDLKDVTEITMPDFTGTVDPSVLAPDEHLFQESWRQYIRSMAIEQRINPRLQRQYMPRRFWPLLTEQQ